MLTLGIRGHASLALTAETPALPNPTFLGYKLGKPSPPAPLPEGEGRTIVAGERPDGVWAEWHWDGDAFRLTTDRLGFLPLFYREGAADFAVSTSLVDLVRPGEAFDDVGLALFLRLGFFLGEHTPFAAIRALPPGASLTWRPRAEVPEQRLQVQGTLPRPCAVRAVPTFDEAIKEYGRLLREAVGSMLPPASAKVGIPLSGGRDSRHLLFAYLSQGRKPAQAFTIRRYPPQPNEDVRVAAQVAAAAGVPHAALSQTRAYFAADLEKNRLTHFCSDEHTWYLSLADYIAREGFTVLYDGLGGDVLSDVPMVPAQQNREWTKLYEAGRLEDLAEDLMEPEGYLPKVLPAAWYRRWNRELARQRVIAELERHQAAPNPVAQFFFWNRTRREIALAPWSLLGRTCHVLTPYLHPAVYDFLTGLPASYFLDQKFHTAAIEAAYPQYAGLPFEAKDAPTERSSWWRNTRYALRTMLFFLRGSPLVRRWFVFPRLLKGLLHRGYGQMLPLVAFHPVYLKQLGELARRGGA